MGPFSFSWKRRPMNKIKYTCKKCGWETQIREEWGDLRPKRCMNKKCNTSFLADPSALITVRPGQQEPEKAEAPKQESEAKPNARSKQKR